MLKSVAIEIVSAVLHSRSTGSTVGLLVRSGDQVRSAWKSSRLSYALNSSSLGWRGGGSGGMVVVVAVAAA